MIRDNIFPFHISAAFMTHLISINLPSSFFQIILALIFLYLELGPVIFAGIGTFLLIIIVNAICSYFVKKWETTKLKAKGKTPQIIGYFSKKNSI